MNANDLNHERPVCEPLLDVADLATMLRRSARTIRYWRAQGFLPTPDVSIGRTCLWRRGTVDQWLDSQPRLGGKPAP